MKWQEEENERRPSGSKLMEAEEGGWKMGAREARERREENQVAGREGEQDGRPKGGG